MRLATSLLSCLLLSSWSSHHHAEAFSPPTRVWKKQARGRSALSASALPPPPPPPPPPQASDPKMIEALVKEASKVLENLQFSDLSGSSLPSMGAWSSSIREQVLAIKDQVSSYDAKVLKELSVISGDLQSRLLTEFPQIRPFYDKVEAFLGPVLQSEAVTITVAAALTLILANFVMTAGGTPAPTSPYPSGRYDPETARAYFDRRLGQALSRGLSILLQSLQFGLGLLSDKINNQIAENEYQRGKELAVLLTKLGPTFIKVGQSLSIRTDILSPAYIRGLETLQDQVPAFDTETSKRIIEAEWGRPIRDVLAEDLSAEPVAAASLGQVFKATLRETGQEIAIKVQRPDITEQIALDMYLLRQFASFAKPVFNLNTDTVGTVDSWGLGFVDELDYLQEARNAEFFSEKIANTSLKDVVFAPRVLNDYSTQSVLVSEWVDGERLDRSSSEDVTILCSIAMNTYLTMLLELGLLHCDPHPGNLLRVKEDGRLCILDWGMVTRLDKDLQLTLIEHMAHLTSADYAEIPKDLLLLGFIPEDKKDLIADSGLVDVLADIYGAWTSGGGVAAINVNQVINQLQDLTAEKGNLFQIPPYFAYIAKSFSVLEGIGLSNDERYSIVNECLPYVSKRLLTDKEAMGPALSTFIFGPEKSSKDRIVSYKRVEQLIEGFGEYTTSSSGALLGKEDLSRAELLEDAADQILDLVFTEEETPLQKIMLEQLAKIISSGGRSVLTNLRERSGTLPSGRTVLGTIVDPLGLFRTSPLVRMNELDEKTVETTRKIVLLMQKQVQEADNPAFDLSDLSREESMQLSSILVRKIWSRRLGVLQTGNRFVRQLLQLTAEKLEDGERDTRTLPQRPLEPAVDNSEDSSGTTRLESKPAESRRLQDARALLQGLQNEPLPSLPEAVPVKTDIP